MKPVGDIDIIRKILIKSREKQKTAKIDYEHERFEDSVSRAYYAVFHAIDVKTPQCHSSMYPR